MSKNDILFVEDVEALSIGVETSLKATGSWNVISCKTYEDALRILDKMSLAGDLPRVISVDLGLQPKPRGTEIGINLLKKIRERWEGLPIVIHSFLDVKDNVVKTIISQGASYFYLFDDADVKAYVDLLPYMAQGFLVYSPTPASRLPQVVSVIPDPFQNNPEIWKTLQHLALGLTYARIGDKEEVGERAIMARVKRAALVLEMLGEIELPPDSEDATPERYKPYVIEWYHRNRVRFGY